MNRILNKYPKASKNEKNGNSDQDNFKNNLGISPDNLPKMTPPLKKITNQNEEIIPVQEIKSDSIYVSYKNGNIFNRLDAKNLMNNEDIWCSSGNHGVKDEIKIKFIFDGSYRMHSLWFYWAFAPGEFRIQYSNDDNIYFDIFANKFRLSEQNSSILWWKKIISNPITRWQHRSFDERIDLENPVFAKFIEISMRIPVNKYFGLYKIEFYKNLKTIAIIKSKAVGKNNCLSVINGDNSSGSPLISNSCIDTIGFGDNRDLFVLNSNNLITTLNSGLCINSPTDDIVEVVDCSEAEEYKDDRNKWIIEYNGLIRSKKNPGTCLSVVDDSYRYYIESNSLRAEASSTVNDNLHPAKLVIDYSDLENYWASPPSVNSIIFQILFFKYSAIVKIIEIKWKFPAKKFIVYGLLASGFWKVFEKFTDNREINNIIYITNYDIKGVKIVMYESTTKFEGQNIYGINKIYFRIKGYFVLRQSCNELIDDINKWEIIDVNFTDLSSNKKMKNQFNNLYKIELKLESITKTFESIPAKLIEIKEKSIKISEELKNLNDVMEISRYKLTNFEALLSDNQSLNKNILGENKYFPAGDCYFIRKTFPHKRSGFYWIKNECFPEPIKMYCDFVPDNDKVYDYYIIYDKEKYVKKSNEEFLKKQKEINNESGDQKNLDSGRSNQNLDIDYFDLRKMCTDLGLIPLEIKEIRNLNVIKFLINLYNVDLGNEQESFGVPVGIDFNCIYRLTKKDQDNNLDCSENFKSLSNNKSNTINNIFKEYSKKQNSNNENNNVPIINGNSQKNGNTGSDDKGVKDNNDDEDLKDLDYYEFFGFTSFGKFQKFSSLDTKVNTVVCSTMKNDINNSISAMELTCSSNLRDLDDQILSNNKKIKNHLKIYNQEISVLCPRNCSKFYNSLVYGTDIYTDNSSICRASIHSGILKDAEGGIALMIPYRGLDYYSGSKQFYIESLDFPGKWIRSFKIKRYTPDCAKDIVINLEDNVSSNKNIVSLSNKKNFEKGKDRINFKENKVENNLSNFYDNITKDIDNKHSLIKNNDKLHFNKNHIKDNKNRKISGYNDIFKSNINIENDNYEFQSMLSVPSNINKHYNFKTEIKNKDYVDDFPFLSFLSIEETIANTFLSKINLEDKSSNSKIIPSTDDQKPNLEILIKFMEYLRNNKQISLKNNVEEDKINSNEIILPLLLDEGIKDNKKDQNNKEKSSEINKNDFSKSLNQNNIYNEIINKNEYNKNMRFKDKEISIFHKNLSRDDVDEAINKLRKEEMDAQKQLEENAKEKSKKNSLILDKNDIPKDNPLKSITTDEAMVQINQYIKFLRKQVQDILFFSEEFKKFVSKISSKIYLINHDKARGLINQNSLFKAYLSKISTIKKLMEKLELFSQTRIKKSEFNFYLLKKKIGKLIKRDNFYEDYTNQDILINYEIFNGKLAKGLSTWNYYHLNLKGHNWVIQQKSQTEDDLIGSQLIVMNRDFYDFELSFTVNINSDGTFGVAFRHKNQFNFYVLEISRKDKGFKRLRKFINGTPTLLASKSDGGYLPNKWLTIKILCENSNIRVYATQEEMQNMDNSVIKRNLALVFHINDSEFMHGTVAFGSNSIGNLMLDDISIKQLACTDFLALTTQKVNVFSDSCDKYIEFFKSFSLNWESVDPINSIGGPSNWTNIPNYESRANVLAQLSEIHGLDENEEGTIYLLKNKICEKGFIKVKGKILLENEELVKYNNQIIKKPERAFGLVFKYQDYENFYLIEIFNDCLVRFRKKIQGVYKLISQNPLIGFAFNTWFKLMVYIKNNRFSFRFFKNSNKPHYQELFTNDVVDEDLKFGRIGLFTFKTKAIFQDFETFKFILGMPIRNVSVEPLYIDENEDEKIKKIAEKMNPLSNIIEKKSKEKDNLYSETKNKQILHNLASNAKLKTDYVKKSPEENSESISKYHFILNQLNKNIPDYSWNNCLLYNTPEKKLTQCQNLFTSENDIYKCKLNFCPTCCNKFVKFRTNLSNHRYLCVKQCNIIANPSDKVKFWSKCITPDSYSFSFYGYCDKVFQFDDIGKYRCKVDMCKLCCVNVDVFNPKISVIPHMSENLLKKCNNECIKCINFLFIFL